MAITEARPTCIECFSGAGGLSLGLHRAGFDVRLAFDCDADSVASYNANQDHHPSFAVCRRIEELSPKTLLREAGLEPGQLVLLAGGPPCQGFSVQRIGRDQDSRNNLVLEFLERIIELKPWFFLLENVPGIKGRRGSQFLSGLLAEVREAGYLCHSTVLDASDFGVPQRRRRVFVVGERLPSGASRFSFPALTTSNSQLKMTVRQAIGHLPSPPKDGSEHPLWLNHRRDKLSQKNLERLRALSAGQGRVDLPSHLLADCHRASADAIGHRNVYGRMSWDEVAPTITARFDSFTRGQFGHPQELRSISLREGAILQGFPETFRFVGSKVSVARQIGNAVPPPLAEAIGRSLVGAYAEELEGLPARPIERQSEQLTLFPTSYKPA